MMNFKIILVTILFACCSEPPTTNFSNSFTARVTYYTGSEVADPNTKRAQEGVSVAAHPRFKFGTKMYIPMLDGVIGDGNFIVHDRGPAVTRRVASRGKTPVIDVYVSSSKKIAKYSNSNREYMKVFIFQ